MLPLLIMLLFAAQGWTQQVHNRPLWPNQPPRDSICTRDSLRLLEPYRDSIGGHDTHLSLLLTSPDTSRTRRELELLVDILQLDSLQAMNVRAVLDQRLQQLQALRMMPIKEPDIRRLRLQKIHGDADQKIRGLLNQEQNRLYAAILTQRQQQMKDQEQNSRDCGKPPRGGPGFSGPKGGGFDPGSKDR
jgi:hypothetical protein